MAERADPGVGPNNNKTTTERTGRGRWGVPHACVAGDALAVELRPWRAAMNAPPPRTAGPA